MKNIINVSIAGIAFKLDEEAYTLLESYLNKIRNGYGNSPEGEEIINDIEARIAEIILTRQDMNTTVERPLIEEMIRRLGSPEDISEGSETQKENPAKEKEKENFTQKINDQRIPHRLYRNPEGAKFGGVCSGLAAYFNIDPVMVRLLFAAPLILLIFFSIVHVHWIISMMTGFMTTSFILYFLLWIVIPKAKTPLQKLEMKGEKFTKDKIEQTFREEFQSRSNDPHNIALRARNEKNASVFSEFVSIIGRILLFLAKALAALIGLAITINIVVLVVLTIKSLTYGAENLYGISATSPALIGILISCAIILPLGLIVYGILKFLFGFKHNKPLVTTIMVIWILTLIFGTVIAIKDSENISSEEDHISIIGWRIKLDHDEHYESNQYIDIEDEVDMSDIDEVETVRSQDDLISHWQKFEIAGDSLVIVPAINDSVRMPDNFTVKIKKGNPKYPEPVMAVRKYTTHKRSQKSDAMKIEHELKGDTLFIQATFPKDAVKFKERGVIELFLPENTTAIVDGRINYNEYYQKK